MLCISFLLQGQGSAPSLSAAGNILFLGIKGESLGSLLLPFFLHGHLHPHQPRPFPVAPPGHSQWQDTLCLIHFRLLAVVFPLSFELCTQQEEKLPLLSNPQKAESAGVALLTSGEGNWDLFPSTGATKSMSCRMVVMCWAMTFCCSTLQWFSREMMTGYGEVWNSKTEHTASVNSVLSPVYRNWYEPQCCCLWE